MTKSILVLAFEAGIRPFDPIPAVMASSRNIGDLAALLLAGRNPYFDREYRERYGTKVHSLELLCDRLALGAVESALPTGQSQRRYRAVIFRCDGEVLHQTGDSRVLDQNGAHVDLRHSVTHLSTADILRDLCLKQVKTATRLKDNAERVLLTLGAGP